MVGAHIALDHTWFGLIVLFTSLVDWLWFYPRLVCAKAAGVPGARARYYAGAIVTGWMLAAGTIALWIMRGRPWAALNLGLSTPLRLGIGFGIAVLYVILAFIQRRAVAARPDRLEKIRKRLGTLGTLLPHTPGELRGFLGLSLTAGVCEELLFRGFIWWYFTIWTGPIIAVVISGVFFGFAHVYLGLPHVLKTGVVGVALGFLVLAFGSLWPVMIIHTAMDMVSGDVAFRALSQAPPAVGPASDAAAAS